MEPQGLTSPLDLSATDHFTASLKAEALRLGFDLVGITTPEPPQHMEVYQRWIAAGRHGQMAYLATERAWRLRADPRSILPECRSIVVLGTRHALPEPPCAPGQIAAYALGRDYHDLLVPRLQALVAFLEDLAGGPILHRAYADTGPVLERALAQRAGLGWIGKNTCLIHPRIGSYFLLAEILLGLELQPDPAFHADRCGSCTRCLEACPTRCILPDRTLDATRCISYLTIELKGAIPPGQRPALGDWIFGCDICQQVCPWNRRFAASASDPAWLPEFPALQVPELLALDAQAIRVRFRTSPVRRVKRAGLLRNAAVVAGNSRIAGATTALARLLAEDPEPVVRAHAAWALGCIGGVSARAALERAALAEAHPDVRAEIGDALEALRGAAGERPQD